MTKQDEIIKLREHPKHYLWDKPRNQWTKEDLEALFNPSESQIMKKRLNRKNKLPVIGKKDGVEKEFKSIKDASVEMGVSTATIYQQLAYNSNKPKAKITFRRPEIVTEQYHIYESSMNYVID